MCVFVCFSLSLCFCVYLCVCVCISLYLSLCVYVFFNPVTSRLDPLRCERPAHSDCQVHLSVAGGAAHSPQAQSSSDSGHIQSSPKQALQTITCRGRAYCCAPNESRRRATHLTTRANTDKTLRLSLAFPCIKECALLLFVFSEFWKV